MIITVLKGGQAISRLGGQQEKLGWSEVGSWAGTERGRELGWE